MLISWDEHNRWILYESCIYLNGVGLHVGGDLPDIINDTAIKDNDNLLSIRIPFRKLKLIPTIETSLNWAFIEDLDSLDSLKHITKLMKPGAHLILLNCQLTDDDIIKARKCGWTDKLRLIKGKEGEENELRILKIRVGGKKGISTEKSVPEGGDPAVRRACVVRFGAIGDLIMITPLLRRLSTDGYSVTVLTQQSVGSVLKENPFVDNLIFQGRNVIPNPELGQYMKYWEEKYDKFINLSESIEGKYLKVENRRSFYLPKEERISNLNFYDATLKLAGYCPKGPTKAELYFTDKELKEASKFIKPDTFTIMWALKGSSYHKIYPIAQPLLKEWIKDKPDVQVYITGAGPDTVQWNFEVPPQVISLVDQLPIRASMALTSMVDLVVGPETGMLNAAGCFDTPKILFMSHSKPVNLAKYWDNAVCLEPKVPCYPCFQLHYSKESCPIQQLTNAQGTVIYEGPACTAHQRTSGAISAERVMAEMDKVYQKWQATRNSQEQN